MADWYGTSRSNYVKLINVEQLKEQFSDLSIHSNGAGLQCIISENGNGGDPSDPEGELHFLDVIQNYLEKIPDNVFVWVQAGAEKARYITGDAIAIDHTGQVLNRVSLEDIYEDSNYTRAEY